VSVNQFVMNDIASVIAREIDRVTLFGKAMDGSGYPTNQPIGVVNQTNVAHPAISASGGKLSYAKLVELEERVAESNADIGTLAYLTNARVRGALKTTLKADSVSGYLWEGAMGDGDGMVNGYRCAVSNVVPGNLSKGASGATKANLSVLLFGNFSDIIIGEWSVLDMMVNPYGPGSDAGTIRIRALQDIDVAVRHPQSFAYFDDVWTSATT
jgi:HK97 family phage major capsid protein